MTKLSLLLNELKRLNLPKSEYSIMGSGPLAVHGIREANDLDIVVSDKLWYVLKEKYADKYIEKRHCIEIGNIEIFNKWGDYDSNYLLSNSELIDGFPYVYLRVVLAWKKRMGRPKDLIDIELIQKYMSK